MERPIIEYPGAFNHWLNFWIADHPTRSIALWYGVWILLALFLLVATGAPSRRIPARLRGWLEKDPIFLAAVSVFLLGLRLPLLGYLREFNVDESEWIAGAATLVRDWRFWVAFDGHTSGPLNILPLTSVYYLGGSLSYGSIRLWATIACIIPSIWFVFFALRQTVGSRPARLLVIPLIAFFGLLANRDLVAYNSEQVPLLLTAIAVFLAVRILSQERPGFALVAITGFTLGLFPYSKLQAAPIAFAIGLFLLFGLFRRRSFRSAIILLVAAVAPTFLIVLAVWSYDGLHDFWQSYVVTNLHYGRHEFDQRLRGTSAVNVPTLVTMLQRTWLQMAPMLLILITGVVVFSRRFISSRATLERRQPLWLAAIVFGVAVCCIILPGTAFDHYMMLLVIPAVFLGAQLLGGNLSGEANLPRGLVLTASILLPLGLSTMSSPIGLTIEPVPDHILNAARAIRQLEGRRAHVAMWGWQCRLFVYTEALPGTREAHTHYQLTPSTEQSYYLRRFIEDLQRTNPSVFVDATGSEGAEFYPPTLRADQDPKLGPLLRQYYVLRAEVEGDRIYVRK